MAASSSSSNPTWSAQNLARYLERLAQVAAANKPKPNSK